MMKPSSESSGSCLTEGVEVSLREGGHSDSPSSIVYKSVPQTSLSFVGAGASFDAARSKEVDNGRLDDNG